MFQIGTWLCSFKTYSLKRSLKIVFVLDRSVFTQKFLTSSTGSLRTCITNSLICVTVYELNIMKFKKKTMLKELIILELFQVAKLTDQLEVDE